MSKEIPESLSDIVLALPGPLRPGSGRRPLLAVSGGRDSMLLMHVFSDLHVKGHLPQPAVFHLHHGLREDATADLECVRRECQRLRLSFYYEHRDIAACARRMRRGLEEAGRLLRYRLLARLAQRLGPAYGVSAHHADDYLESLLLHLVRGGGPGSLATLPYWQHIDGLPLLRPFLGLCRQQITELVTKYGIPFREDPSNQSPQFRRNRMRNTLIPLLKAEGLDPVKLWKNFHSSIRIHLTGLESQRPGEYLSLDRRLLGPGLDLKALFDLCLKSLGLMPATRPFLLELQSQIKQKTAFRVAYSCSQFYLWSDRRGPLWLFRRSAAVFFPFQSRRLQQGDQEQEFEVCYNHSRRRVSLRANERLGSFREGLRAPLEQGTKKVKKIFQEAGLPPPVRAHLPLIWNENTGRVTRIFFSFWEQKKDRFFTDIFS